MPNANIDKWWRAWKLFLLCLSWHSPVSNPPLSKHLSEAFSCWTDVVDPLIYNRGSRWNEMEEELEETNNYTDILHFYGVFQPINGNKSENGAPWSINASMMLRTLSMCSGTLASKSETHPLITIDLSGHRGKWRSSDHLRSDHAWRMLRSSCIFCGCSLFDRF